LLLEAFDAALSGEKTRLLRISAATIRCLSYCRKIVDTRARADLCN
uniref:RNA polymerase subunit sigma n=1 Tax=Rodentolepis nana TaxID=102285 RepID=A0A0R3TGL7_RODNA